MLKSTKACIGCDWHLAIWDRENPSQVKRVPWTCRSWRHEGECRLWKGSQDFQRVAEAIKTLGPWTYIVLTFAQGEWPNKYEQYRSGVTMWAKLRKRIRRQFGLFKYIQTWEKHLKGGAHVNVVVANKKMHEIACLDFREVRNWLEPHAVQCGFGFRTWVEPVMGSEGMAGYLTKMGEELIGQGRKDQVPIDAPPHFRRIRASSKTLPPPIKSDLTGKLTFTSLDGWIKNTVGQDCIVPNMPGRVFTGMPAEYLSPGSTWSVGTFSAGQSIMTTLKSVPVF